MENCVCVCVMVRASRAAHSEGDRLDEVDGGAGVDPSRGGRRLKGHGLHRGVPGGEQGRGGEESSEEAAAERRRGGEGAWE